MPWPKKPQPNWRIKSKKESRIRRPGFPGAFCFDRAPDRVYTKVANWSVSQLGRRFGMAPAKVRTQIHRQLSAPMIDDAEQSVVPGQEFREVPVDELLPRVRHRWRGLFLFPGRGVRGRGRSALRSGRSRLMAFSELRLADAAPPLLI